MNILELLAIPQYGVPDNVALSYTVIMADDTFSDILRTYIAGVDELARGLVAWGLQRGDRAGVLSFEPP